MKERIQKAGEKKKTEFKECEFKVELLIGRFFNGNYECEILIVDI